MLKVFVVLTCLLWAVTAQTTQSPHHGPSVKEQYGFVYDGNTHLVLVKKGTTCYIWQITPDERIDVHTDAGFAAIETRILTEIADSYYTRVPARILNTHIIHACKGAGMFFLVH